MERTTAGTEKKKSHCRATLSGLTGSALVWHSEVARSRLTQCIKSCDLQPALQCAIRGAQGVLPCVWWGVRPVNWIYRLSRHCP